MDKNTVYAVQKYLEKKRIASVNHGSTKMDLRAKGKEFSFPEHIQAMVYSLLSAQTVWANIERNMPRIDKLFFNYDPDEIKKKDYQYFVDGLARLRCRSRLTNAQMKALHGNIAVMEEIIAEYGSMDRFVTAKPQGEIVQLLSNPNSKYKLRQMGPALVWEYLRNVGVDGAKPDVHMKRILGSNRLAFSDNEEASDDEVLAACKKMSEETGLWMAEIDYLFWAYCATDQGEICTANPKCNKCVIRDQCRHIK